MLDELNPPTKLVGKFLRTWGEREKQRAKFYQSSITMLNINIEEPAHVALNLSWRPKTGARVKSILHIKAGIEMLALAMLISSEVHYHDIFESH